MMPAQFLVICLPNRDGDYQEKQRDFSKIVYRLNKTAAQS